MAEYIKHTGGSVAGKSKKPYDAMVYKDADSGYTIAVDGNGNVIKKVLSSANTDDVVIQHLIDVSSSNYNILLSAGDYNLSTKLIFTNKDNVSLFGVGQQTNLNLTTDMRCLEFNGKSSYCEVGNFKITVVATNTSSIISVNPVAGDYIRWSTLRDIIIFNSNSVNNGWNGIRIAPTGNGFLLGNTFRNILMWGWCTKGITFENDGGGGNAWSNANTFDNIFVWWPIIGVDFTDIAVGCANDANTFIRVHVQIDVTRTTDGFKNIFQRANVFYGCTVWDWRLVAAPNYSYSFRTGSINNVIYGSQEGSTISTSVSDLGTGNMIFDPRYRVLKSSNILTVAPCGGDYDKLSTALSKITDGSSSNIYTIFVNGYIEEAAPITAKSYVNVEGTNGAILNINSDTNTEGVTFTGVNDTKWSNIKIIRSGTPPSSRTSAVYFESGIPNSVKLINCEVLGNVSSYGCHGITIKGSPTLIDVNSTAMGVTSYGHGIYIPVNSKCDSIFINCVARGGNYSSSAGIMISQMMGTPTFLSCSGYGGSSATSYGIENFGGGEFIGCNFYGGTGGTNCHSIYNDSIMSATYVGCISSYQTYSSSHSFTGSNNTILPFGTHPYFVNKIYVYVTVAGAGGSTLDIGTSPGGSEIASSIPTDSTGIKQFTFTKRAISGDSYIYLTFSDTSTRATIYYTVGYNYSDCYGLKHAGYAQVKYNSCTFNSNFSSAGAYITTTAITDGTYRFNKCIFNSLGSYDFSSQSLGLIKLNECTFVNGTRNNVIIPGKGNNATIVAGSTYVDVTHGLVTTPTLVRITPTTNLGTRSFWVDTKGATTFRININSSDVIDHTFDWEAEV